MEQKKNKIVALIVIIIIIIGVVLSFLIISKQKEDEGGLLGVIGSFPNDVDNNSGNNNTSNDGDTNSDNINLQDQTQDKDIVLDSKKPTLEKIAEGPIAGAVSFFKGDTETIRYVEKDSGIIQEINMDTDKTVQISKRTIRKIHDAYWQSDGDKTLIRFLLKEGGVDTIKTYWTYAETVNNTNQIGGFLPDGIKEITVAGDTDKILYICDKNCDSLADDNAFGISSNFNNTEREQEFFVPLKEWVLQWPKTNTLALTTKPSYNIVGYSYIYNNENERLEKVVGDRPGLTTLYNTDGSRVLLAESGSSYIFSVYNINEKTEKDLVLKAIPEKCVWSNEDKQKVYCSVPKNFKNRDFPDNWYQGRVNFSDNIWTVDTDTVGQTSLSLKLEEESGEKIDATRLFLGNNEDYLYFTNKTDGSLWVYRMVQ